MRNPWKAAQVGENQGKAKEVAQKRDKERLGNRFFFCIETQPTIPRPVPEIPIGQPRLSAGEAKSFAWIAAAFDWGRKTSMAIGATRLPKHAVRFLEWHAQGVADVGLIQANVKQ